MDKKFENICFCCLTEEDHFKNMLEEEFTAAQNKIQFIEGYTVCSGIVPDLESIKYICSVCALKLQSSFEFRELCRASYETLKDKIDFVPDLYVDVKHEVPSDVEEEFLYDTVEKKEDKKSKKRHFTQVYVRDLNLEPPKTRTATRRSSVKPSLENLANIEEKIPLKAEEEQLEDEKPDNELKRRIRGPYKKKKKTELQKLKRAHVKTRKIKKQPPPVSNVADMESTFQCTHCETVLGTYNEYLNHRETAHKVGNKYQSHSRVCGLCNTEVKQYVDHIAECHKDYRPSICSYCDRGKCQTPLELRGHLYSHLTCEATHECQSCHDKFKNEVHLRTHISTNHKNINNTYLCPHCGLEFSQFVQCNAHFSKVHNDPEQMVKKKMFPCFHCKKIYMVGKYYEDHDCAKRNVDLKEQPTPKTDYVNCGNCGFQFSCPDELACHNSRGCDADFQANKCLKCGKCFESRKKLVKHGRLHEERKKLFVCDVCGYAGQSVSNLKGHMFSHVTERPFKCHLCSATFKENKHLIGHQKVHDETKPFECYLCLKRFRSYSNVKDHMAVHSESSLLRKFACEVCGKTTISATTLKSHMITHTHERNMKCTFCPKAFGNMTNLKNHIRKKHEGFYYECIFCGQHYSEKVKLNQHLFKHRGFKPYNCPVCPFQQVLKHVFVKHLRDRHTILFDERLHGYREAENIKQLIEECERRPNDTKKLISFSGVRIVDTKSIRHKPQRYVEPSVVVPQPKPECSYGTQMSEDSGPVNMLMQKQYFIPYDRPEDLPPTGYHYQGNQ